MQEEAPPAGPPQPLFAIDRDWWRRWNSQPQRFNKYAIKIDNRQVYLPQLTAVVSLFVIHASTLPAHHTTTDSLMRVFGQIRSLYVLLGR